MPVLQRNMLGLCCKRKGKILWSKMQISSSMTCSTIPYILRAGRNLQIFMMRYYLANVFYCLGKINYLVSDLIAFYIYRISQVYAHRPQGLCLPNSFKCFFELGKSCVNFLCSPSEFGNVMTIL